MTLETLLTEKSRITLGLAVILITLAFSMGIAYSQIADLRLEQFNYRNTVERIDKRLSRIEGHLGVGVGE